jgi:predicted nucleic acid-binding protein
MAQYFIDSSALLKRYRDETGSQRVVELMATSERSVVSRLAHVEVSAALVRRARQSAGVTRDLESVLSALDNDIRRDFRVVEFSEPLIARAVDLVRAYGLRAADAIQLAAALVSRPDPPPAAGFYLMSADDELNAAATAEGLPVENPNLHP